MIVMEGRLLNLGTISSNNVKFAKDCKLIYPEKVPVTWNFGRDPNSIIGNAEIFRDNDGLFCKVQLTNEMFTDDEYFVGGYYDDVKMHKENSIDIVDACSLRLMSIVLAPADENLKIRRRK